MDIFYQNIFVGFYFARKNCGAIIFKFAFILKWRPGTSLNYPYRRMSTFYKGCYD